MNADSVAAFDLTVLSVRPRTVVASLESLERYLGAADHASTLLGCWYSEIGAINRIVLLRRARGLTELTEERRALALAASPFQCGEHVMALEMDTCVAVAGSVRPGAYGAAYGIRTARDIHDAPAQSPRGTPLISLRAVTGAMPRSVQITAWRNADELLAAQASAADAAEPDHSRPRGADETVALFMPAKFSPMA